MQGSNSYLHPIFYTNLFIYFTRRHVATEPCEPGLSRAPRLIGPKINSSKSSTSINSDGLAEVLDLVIYSGILMCPIYVGYLTILFSSSSQTSQSLNLIFCCPFHTISHRCRNSSRHGLLAHADRAQRIGLRSIRLPTFSANPGLTNRFM